MMLEMVVDQWTSVDQAALGLIRKEMTARLSWRYNHWAALC